MVIYRVVYGTLPRGNDRSQEASLQRRSALETPKLIALGGIATLVAMVVGTILAVIIALPLSLLAIIFFPIFLGCVLLGGVLAAPVTLILFPLAYELMRGRPILAQFA